MASGSSTLKCLYFKSNSKIVLADKKLITYHNTSKFDMNEARSQNWHEIRVHHNAKYCKNDILKALFNTIGNVAFYPVKYIEENEEDHFYVRKCLEALKELFKFNLILKTPPKAPRIFLSVRFNVADYAKGQIMPEHKIEDVIKQQFLNLKTHCGVSDVLSLENMMDHIELGEVVVYLGIAHTFSLLCEILSKLHYIVNSINGINLSNNNIKSLLGISHLEGAKWDIIDLRLNNIRDINQIYKLQCIQVKELHIAGNPIEKDPNTLGYIKDRFKGLVKLNGALLKDINNIADVSTVDACEVEFTGKLVLVDNYNDFYLHTDDKKWHQIKIEHGGRYTQQEIVKAIFACFVAKGNTDPFHICYYKTGATEDSFLVRKHVSHLKLLLQTYKLTIPIKDKTIKLKLILDAAEFKKEHISEDLIMTALRKCLNDRKLNLSKFSSSPIFKNRFILNMGLPKIYGKCLSVGSQIYADIIEVNLSDNCIRDGIGMRALKEMKSLKLLILSNNDLLDLVALDPIKDLPITALFLDGNPLCKKYKLCKDYINDVTSMFPELLTLDGIELKSEGIFIPKKNYLCNLEAIDLVEQFVGKYFKLFDSQNKEDSIKMYSIDAIFTLSNYSTHASRQAKFTNCSRKRNDYTKNAFVGLQIYDILKSLPEFQHDFHSFTTDVHFYVKDLIVFTITGALRLLSKTPFDADVTFAFSRNFVLKRMESASNIGIFFSTTEYVISNDQLALTDLTHAQYEEIFRVRIPQENRLTKAVENEEKTAFFIMFQQLTRLKTQWCRRCLEEADYDFHKSLEIFLDYMKKKLIPKNAFLNNT